MEQGCVRATTELEPLRLCKGFNLELSSESLEGPGALWPW